MSTMTNEARYLYCSDKLVADWVQSEYECAELDLIIEKLSHYRFSHANTKWFTIFLITDIMCVPVLGPALWEIDLQGACAPLVQEMVGISRLLRRLY